MNSIMKNFSFILLTLLISCITVFDGYARVELITSADQLSSNANNDSIGNLLDDKVYTSWSSAVNPNEDQYLTVTWNTSWTLSDNECIVIHIQRSLGEKDPAPTTFKVQVSSSETLEDWKDWCYAYLLYRGPGTHEYSARLCNHNGTPESIRRLRFTVTANNVKKQNNGHREMMMAEFNLIKLSKKEDYTDRLKDRLHLKTDYTLDYKDWDFEFTRGVVNKANKLSDWVWQGGDDGRWNKDTKFLEDNGIVMPDMSFDTLPGGQLRQRTHVVEHELYAVPGDAVALYPYYQLIDHTQYKENFSHWYDYENGGRILGENAVGQPFDLLDFLIDPSRIAQGDKFGYIGGSAIKGSIHLYSDVVNVGTVADYRAFVNRANNGENNLVMDITADLDFAGEPDVPMLGTSTHPFCGVINGNGHTISNLTIAKTDEDGVGLVKWGGDNLQICNLIVDASCSFIGKNRVGLVAQTMNSPGYPVRFTNVAVLAAFKASGDYAAGFQGWGDESYSGVVLYTDCFFGGKAEVKKNGDGAAAFSGLAGKNKTGHRLVRCYNNGTVINPDGYSKYLIHISGELKDVKGNLKNTFSNCQSNGEETGVSGISKITDDFNLDSFKNICKFDLKYDDIKETYLEREHGTVATFFYPRTPYEEDGQQKSLPKEYVIAADFSQKFNETKNMISSGDGNGKFIEPTIAFRHIFRIKDGKQFAEDFSGSLAANEEYVRKHRRYVSARADERFQIRFDSPVPAEGTTRSKYYYKISDSDYRRICTMDIEVFDATGKNKVNNVVFKPGEKFDGQGSRYIDGIEYRLCGGGGSYYRMLMCDYPPEGTYVVRLYGNDINGKPINIIGTDKRLVVMEYHITFLNSKKASLLSEEDLAKPENKKMSPEYLQKTYGNPKATVNFDNYRYLETLTTTSDYLRDGKVGKFFKWPVSWDRSTYSFGYDKRYDYNMYMIANCNMATSHYEPTNFGEIYDRLYYDTKKKNEDSGEQNAEPEKGYFFYVNASTDPGVMARLNIPTLCNGSTIHVSAWVAEFNDFSETANVAFNFIAVMKEDKKNESKKESVTEGDNVSESKKDKERVIIHTFVTGYLEPAVKDNANQKGECGKWMHVYYSFVPSFADAGISIEDVDHYELELDNNCKNSNGADYAIDDIRAYISQPVVYAKQKSEVCEKSVEKATVQVNIPYDVILETLGLTEATSADDASTAKIYYTFIDKKKFDEEYAKNLLDKNIPNPGAKAYESSVLRYGYRGSVGATTFGNISFSTHYDSNKAETDASVSDADAFRYSEDGVRMVSFLTEPEDAAHGMKPGDEYYISIFPYSGADDKTPGWTEFDIKDKCAKVCVFTVLSSDVVKIDGVLVQDKDNVEVCENQSPVVQIDLWGKKTENGTLEELEKNAYFDWFNGTNDKYESIIVKDKDNKPVKYKVSSNGVTVDKDMPLSYAMACFRKEYPKADDCSIIEAKGVFTEDMRLFIHKMATDTTDIPTDAKRPLLTLYRSSYVFPPLKITTGTEAKYHVLALPVWQAGKWDNGTNYVICTAPTQVNIVVKNHSPLLKHGLTQLKGFYPDRIWNVPLRLGLQQLLDVSMERNGTHDPKCLLDVPVRYVYSRYGFPEMTAAIGEPVYLVETNDPEYKDLCTINLAGAYTENLYQVGELRGFRGVVNGDGNFFRVAFYKGNDFIFKEGYYYSMRFGFKESGKASSDSESGSSDSGSGSQDNQEIAGQAVCDGQDVFTIKVVPEFQKWTGKVSLNFNDDNNWERVESSELLRKSKKEGDFPAADYFTDGSNTNRFSYAPLDFTKVIVPAGRNYPRLYEETENEGYELFYYSFATDYDGPAKFYNGIDKDTGKEKYIVRWVHDPNPKVADMESGYVTPDVHYDMVAYRSTSDIKLVKCRPWYSNTCEQIHFDAHSEIVNQQNLYYNKAWVDMVMAPSRWYLASSPLQQVVAGDMYLPTDGARQETELFKPISFNEGVNDRFAPAVYQRGWDKSEAIVYELPSASQEEKRNVATRLNWSHVYNDVKAQYRAGAGYSVKTDVSRAKSPGESVLFRLPKADTSYEYYGLPGNQHGESSINGNVGERPNKHRLNLIKGDYHIPNKIRDTLTNANGSPYFLVGNPFMAHIDMKKFLLENSSVIEPKYWIISGDKEISAILNGGNFQSTGTEELQYIAPMQGFFVVAKGETVTDADRELNLLFTTDMLHMEPYDPDNGILLRSPTRGADGCGGMLITVMGDDGADGTAALLTVDGAASREYREAEDVLLLDDPHSPVAAAFTIAGDRAASINALDDAEGTEIGVMAGECEWSTLTFSNVGAFAHLSLLDTQTGDCTPLSEGMTVRVKGAAHGRFFLTSYAGSPATELLGLRLRVKDDEVRVTAPNAASGIEVAAYTPGGILVAEASCTGEAVMRLAPGVYIVCARASDGTTLRRKIVIE